MTQVKRRGPGRPPKNKTDLKAVEPKKSKLTDADKLEAIRGVLQTAHLTPVVRLLNFLIDL